MHSGFTLIEVLIALAVLAIGLVALLQLHVLSLRSSDRAARQGEALRLASDKLAEALAKPSPEPGAGAGGEEGPMAGMEWRVMVAPAAAAELNGAEAPGLMRVTVEVVWADGPRERKVGLTTYALARP